MNFFFKVLVATLFLILVYIFYRSEIDWGGYKRDIYLIYLIGTCLAIFFLIIFKFLNIKIQKYIIIIFISIIFTLYTFEGKLTFDEKKTHLNYNLREVYEDLKKTNLNVTVTAPPLNFLTFNELELLSLAVILHLLL